MKRRRGGSLLQSRGRGQEAIIRQAPPASEKKKMEKKKSREKGQVPDLNQ